MSEPQDTPDRSAAGPADTDLPALREVTGPTHGRAVDDIAPPPVDPERLRGGGRPPGPAPLWSGGDQGRTQPPGPAPPAPVPSAPPAPGPQMPHPQVHGSPAPGAGAPFPQASGPHPPGPHPPGPQGPGAQMPAHGRQVRFLPPTGPGGGPRGPHGPVPPRGVPRPPDPADDVTRGLQRPHWVTAVFQTGVVTAVFAALAGPLLLPYGVGWVLLLTFAVLSGATAYALVSWWNSGFELREDHLVVYAGLVRRASREIPLSRLQAVDVVRPIAAQVFGLAELRIELAGGDAGEVRLRYLSRLRAQRLRAALLAHAAGLAGSTPEAPEWPLYRLPFGLLLGALAFRIPVLAGFLLFMLLMAAGFAFGEAGVLGGAVPVLLALMRGFTGPLIRYTDFYASLSPDGLRLRYGAFQARMQTVPPGRVQAVRIVEPLLWRALGVARVEANVAGYVGERQMDSSTLLPVAPRRLAFALIDELFPGAEAARVPLYPAQDASARAEDAAMGIDGRLFATRRGRVCVVTEFVPHARTQSLRMAAGPLARRRGTAVIAVDTPPGPVRARASGRGADEARRALDYMAERGQDARGTGGGPERWATRGDAPAPAPGASGRHGPK